MRKFHSKLWSGFRRICSCQRLPRQQQVVRQQTCKRSSAFGRVHWRGIGRTKIALAGKAHGKANGTSQGTRWSVPQLNGRTRASSSQISLATSNRVCVFEAVRTASTGACRISIRKWPNCFRPTRWSQNIRFESTRSVRWFSVRL